MREAFGIDLGTTNSAIARLVDGKPVAIPVDGSPIVPSVVLYLPDRVVVGREARNLELQHPLSTLRSVKRKMGDADHRYAVNGKQLSPEEVSAEVLRALKRGAESALGIEVKEAVVTVPAYFDDAQRRATLRAGELAGLEVLRLLNEPTSAALIFDQVGAAATAEAATPEIVLVYDLGGGTFDVSVLEVFQGVREVRSTAGNTHLGGDDFDELLVRRFLDHLKADHGVDPRDDPRAMARLRAAAEAAKIELSRSLEVEVRDEFLTRDAKDQPVHLQLKLYRRDFEALIEPLLQSTITLAQQAITDARLGDQKLGRILLVGGSTRIPRCRLLLQNAFGADIREEVDPDLAVALGAAVQAGLLTGATVNRILVDVASHTLGIRVVGENDDHYEEPDTFAAVLHRNTVLPALRTREFYTLVDRQEKLHVDVFQGESHRCSGNTPVGSFDAELVPQPYHSPIKVDFEYDLNGVVKVTVSQPGHGSGKTVALTLADATQSAKAGQSALERKARDLLTRLAPADAAELETILSAFLGAPADQKEAAEEALLDFFLDYDDDDGPDDEDGGEGA